MKKFTIKKLFAVLCLALLVPMSAFADVEINETNFPDANFRNWLLEQEYGQDGVITDDEIAWIRNIDVSKEWETPNEEKISTLEGIQHFTALELLNCYNNQLTSLDVTNNTALTELWCHFNQLTSLNVSGCTALTGLWCSVNQLTSLDVTNNTALTWLYCESNQLTSLDVSNNTALTSLQCNSNQLTSLDVTNNTALTGLQCSSNQLTSLDVSNNTALDYLDCSHNQLTSLDVTNNTALTGLQCYYNQLTSLDVTNNTALTRLQCGRNQLTSLDVSNNTALEWLDCDNNNIKGANMDAFISSLPNRYGIIYIYDSTSETEGNVCTKSQVAKIKEKGWTPYKYNYGWVEYEGSDDPTGIDATEMGNGDEICANAVAYDLNGNRVEDWQSKKGVYIVGGKKVVVK
ncbi:MAG: leucine-rich repeat domain-containing protein [Prevotellaceae bacterium]|nr:leucine-rich repeat domain-containing protein [Prevotellaceae bacterium]